MSEIKMNVDLDKYHRRSIRIKGYDYSSPGFYFITICSHDRQHLFGEIKDGEMFLSNVGNMACKCWQEIPQHFNNVELNQFVIMPNHIHGIIVITKKADIGRGVQLNAPTGIDYYSRISPKNGSLSIIIRTFKGAVTTWCRNNEIIHDIWQRNYYEHIIRNEKDLYNIQGYILNNVSKWQYDLENMQLYKYWSEKIRELEVKRHYDELFSAIGNQ